jgi:predicted phage terminase large subunit-like protein
MTPPFSTWLPQTSRSLRWDWPYVQYIREHLDEVTAGDLDKLMIFAPPRHGKSVLATIHYPAYRLERDPSLRVVIACYNATLAEKFSRRVRAICRARGVALDPERQAVNDWQTAAGGGLRAVGVGGGVAGQGFDVLILDDVVKSREEANSLAYRERCWDWYREDMYTRREPGAALVLIMTRWHQSDLAGRILASDQAADWTVLSLPAEAEEDDPLGRPVGAPLCPDRYDLPALADLRATMGTEAYTALFQQRPQPAGGGMFKRDWWQSFTPEYWSRALASQIIQVWDTAFKAGATNDYSVCSTWALMPSGVYVVDCWRAKVEFPELKRVASDLYAKWKPSAVLIEDKASGQSLLQELRRNSTLPVLPVKVDADKLSRAAAVTPYVEAGRVFLPDGAPWVVDFIDEHADFPSGVYDDMVDCTSMALRFLVLRGDDGVDTDVLEALQNFIG